MKKRDDLSSVKKWEMGLLGFEPKSWPPEGQILTKLDYNPPCVFYGSLTFYDSYIKIL
jgi:hypothetical protein